MCRAEGTPEPECPVDMFAEELLFDNQTQRYPNGVQGLRPSLQRFLRCVITLDGLGDYRAGGVTALVVGRLGRHHSRHIATYHRHHRP